MNSSIVSPRSLLVALITCIAHDAARAQCNTWSDSFARHGINGEVHTLATCDIGTGPKLYVGGVFESAGGSESDGAATWDGTTWTGINITYGTTIYGFAQFDDGSGPAVYGAAHFNNVSRGCVGRLSGTTWAHIGVGAPSGGTNTAYALQVFDDGSGPALYAGGSFTTVNGAATPNIARWNGTTWSSPGSGMDASVNALAVFDDGSGPALYAGGAFTLAGGVSCNRIAKWDGSTWSPLGSGLNASVASLFVFDDGTGAALYAGGTFTAAGGGAANHIAKWNGATWSALGSGTSSSVMSMTAFDDGSGNALYATGQFTTAGGSAATGIARWNGSTWSAIGGGLGFLVGAGCYSAHVFDPGTGPALFVGGAFTTAGGTPVSNFARWNGANWAAIPDTNGMGNGLEGVSYAAEVFDDGSGPSVFVGGSFDHAGATPFNSIARWDGSAWHAVGSGVTGGAHLVDSMVALNSGSGRGLYCGGGFNSPGANVARWDGSAWSALGTGLSSTVFALETFDDGTGSTVYAGGVFQFTGSTSLRFIAKWSGSAWLPLGSGMNSTVLAMTTFDDGGGPALYAGGSFSQADGLPANHIAKWDGTHWSALGSGCNGQVSALAVFDDGSGPALFVGGTFTSAGSIAANNIAKWNGTTWSALGTGVTAGSSPSVNALKVFDVGTGPVLNVGGVFSQAGSSFHSCYATWDGAQWGNIGPPSPGPNVGQIWSLAVFDDGTSVGPDLFIAGDIRSLGPQTSYNIGRLHGCAPTATAFCAGDGSGTPCPCGNNSPVGNQSGCLNSLGLGGALAAHGHASLLDDSARLEGSQMPNAFALYFQGTAQVNSGAGSVFGDGLRCAGGVVRRLGTKANVAGFSRYPSPGDQQLSRMGAVTAPGTRDYQVWYRNSAAFCTSATYNLTNAVQVIWTL